AANPHPLAPPMPTTRRTGFDTLTDAPARATDATANTIANSATDDAANPAPATIPATPTAASTQRSRAAAGMYAPTISTTPPPPAATIPVAAPDPPTATAPLPTATNPHPLAAAIATGRTTRRPDHTATRPSVSDAAAKAPTVVQRFVAAHPHAGIATTAAARN